MTQIKLNYSNEVKLQNYLLRVEGANSSSNILAKLTFSRISSLPLDVICSLLLPPEKLCFVLSRLELKEALDSRLSCFGLKTSEIAPIGCGTWNALFFVLTSRLALRDGKITPATSGIHSCHTLRYLASLGMFAVPSSKKDALASTSQFCCFAQRFFIWSVT